MERSKAGKKEVNRARKRTPSVYHYLIKIKYEKITIKSINKKNVLEQSKMENNLPSLVKIGM